MDEQRDMTKLIVAFCDFASAPKKKLALIDLFSWQFFPEYLFKIVNTILSVLYIYIVRFGNNSAKISPYITADQILGSEETVTYLRELLLFLCFIDIFLSSIYFVRLVEFLALHFIIYLAFFQFPILTKVSFSC